MKDLKSFIKNKKNSQDDKESLTKTVDELSRLSENELMEKLKKEVSGAKKDGSLKQNDFDNFLEKVSGLVSAEQKDKMSSIIDLLKKE